MIDHLLTVLLSKLAVSHTIQEYEKNQENNDSILEPPRFIFWLGLICTILFVCVMGLVVVFNKDRTTILVCLIVFGIMAFLGIYLILYGLNFRVIYKNHTILYRNLFRHTKEYDCKDIVSARYRDSGGIQFVFKNGKKLKFDREEHIFFERILQKEHIPCHDKDTKFVKVQMHPFFRIALWAFTVVCIYFTYSSIFLLLVCIACELSYSTYDVQTKILTRRICGIKKEYDMHQCSVKPFYEDGFLMALEIYKQKQKVGKIPLSREYKNRIIMLHLLNIKK